MCNVGRISTVSWLRPHFLKALTSGHIRSAACVSSSAVWTGLCSRGPPPRCSTKPWIRGAKSKATLILDDLPQGAIAYKVQTEEKKDDAPAYPTVVQQAKNNMRKFDNCVLLTRVGGFYELYFEHAEHYGPLLNLKVAQKKTTAGPVPMAGFPFFQLDRFLKVLVQDLDKYVAISEEFANNVTGKVKSGGLLFDRKVTRIITPGTLIDEKFMDPYENNFLLAIHVEDQPLGPKDQNDALPMAARKETLLSTMASSLVGLAWLDLSTGDFFTQATTMASLSSAIARIRAREIVLDKPLEEFDDCGLLSVLEEDRHLVTYHAAPVTLLPVSEWTPMLESAVPKTTESALTSREVVAGSSLLQYLKTQLQGLTIKLQPPIRRQAEEAMCIDRNSMRGLEIQETARDGAGKGSLFHAVRRTVTKSGARLLRDRLTSPSASLTIIQERLDLVTQFLVNPALRENIVLLLRRSFDSQRLVQKFSLARGDADDLVSLSQTIEVTEHIHETLSQFSKSAGPPCQSNSTEPACLRSILRRLNLDGPRTLAGRISEAIDEEGLLERERIEETDAVEMAALAQDVLADEGSPEDLESLPKQVRKKVAAKKVTDVSDRDLEYEDTWIMRQSASTTLQRLHNALGSLRQAKTELAENLQQSLGASSLTLRWTPGLGHICHVKGVKDVRLSLEPLNSARSVSSTKSTRSFYLPEWSNLGGKIDQAKLQIRAEEQRIFQELRELVILNLVKLRRNAAVLDELDIACSFAALAQEQSLVRPILNLGKSHRIIAGRHPMVKIGLEERGRSFVSNDCFIGDKERVWLITGPNMAGKSTFLRQNALISILAQVGSFVPAEHAEIGIVDQIFSRVGSADNLFRDQSTFMVEMLETAAILKQATPRSFVIMDEVGRGTTPEDGVAVGYACLHHLYHTNQCRTLFATHFHALADMTRDLPKLGCYCTDIAEDASGSFTFVHRLKKGVNRQSHALKVARLAGLPEEAIKVALNILSRNKNI
ncbi:MAG: DNA mismatch repair ATPase msh1 [Pleopsidium flavum]|nr:MAG: DNA mismatch repair ATPase msh1 [Pleopsidium flavum]